MPRVPDRISETIVVAVADRMLAIHPWIEDALANRGADTPWLVRFVLEATFALRDPDDVIVTDITDRLKD